MVVGTLRLTFIIREARSLKDKRRVLNSIKDRLRSQFNASVSEVARHNSHRSAVLGVAVVANEVQAVQQVLEQIERVVRLHPLAELTIAEREIL